MILGPGIIPLSVISCKEVQRGDLGSIDLGLVVLVETPDAPERFLGEQAETGPDPEVPIKGGDAAEHPQHRLGHQGVAGMNIALAEPVPDSPAEINYLIGVIGVKVNIKFPCGG